jgi:hypothetical protein
MAALITPVGMISFPHLFDARAAGPGQDPAYSVSILFDAKAQQSPEYTELRKAAYAKGVEKWGADKMKDAAFTRTLRMPFRSTDEKSYAGYEDGMTFISARTKDRPGVVDARNQEITVPTDVFPGQLGRLFVSPFAYDRNGNKGISFALNHVQITKAKMPRLDGRKAATEAFPIYDDGEGDEIDEQMPF